MTSDQLEQWLNNETTAWFFVQMLEQRELSVSAMIRCHRDGRVEEASTHAGAADVIEDLMDIPNRKKQEEAWNSTLSENE